jgi:hypothetical protein
MMISTRRELQTGNRATYLVAHQKQDGETGTGFRHTSKEMSLPLRPAGTTEHTGELALKLPREPPERILHVCYNWDFLY